MDETRCVKTVFNGFRHHQCRHKRGHGKDGLYCKQHDPERIAKKNAERQRIWTENSKKRAEARRRRDLIDELCKDIPTNELHKYRLVKLQGSSQNTNRRKGKANG